MKAAIWAGFGVVFLPVLLAPISIALGDNDHPRMPDSLAAARVVA